MEYVDLLRYGDIKRPTENYAVGDLVPSDGVVGIVYYASDDIVRIMSVEETIAQDKSEPINSKDELLKKHKEARNKKEKELENKLDESKQYEERLKKIKK